MEQNRQKDGLESKMPEEAGLQTDGEAEEPVTDESEAPRDKEPTPRPKTPRNAWL